MVSKNRAYARKLKLQQYGTADNLFCSIQSEQHLYISTKEQFREFYTFRTYGTIYRRVLGKSVSSRILIIRKLHAYSTKYLTATVFQMTRQQTEPRIQAKFWIFGFCTSFMPHWPKLLKKTAKYDPFLAAILALTAPVYYTLVHPGSRYRILQICSVPQSGELRRILTGLFDSKANNVERFTFRCQGTETTRVKFGPQEV